MRTVFKTAEITDKAILEQLMEIFSAEVRKELDMDTELYECDENELKNSPICRYITYEIQTKENYIKAYLHRFIMQSDSIYIFGLEQSELDAINESNKVGVQIDNMLSDEYSSSLPYRTELYLCKATLVEQLEQQELIKELYERKYNEKPSENMLCLLIEEKYRKRQKFLLVYVIIICQNIKFFLWKVIYPQSIWLIYSYHLLRKYKNMEMNNFDHLNKTLQKVNLFWGKKRSLKGQSNQYRCI